MALEISPKFVVIHFTMANIYAAKVNFADFLLSDFKTAIYVIGYIKENA